VRLRPGRAEPSPGELVHSGLKVVVIDILPESLARARREGFLEVEGDATEETTLRAAGIERARGLITTIDSDAHNVYVILSARAMNPRLFVVARANTEDSEARLMQAGASRVVSPYTMAGHRLAELAVRPRVVDFIDAALSHGELAFSMEEVEVTTGTPRTARPWALCATPACFILAIVAGERSYEANPPAIGFSSRGDARRFRKRGQAARVAGHGSQDVGARRLSETRADTGGQTKDQGRICLRTRARSGTGWLQCWPS